MKYLDLLWALDIISKQYPKYYSNELYLLADDVFRWFNNELPEDSSSLAYLKSLFGSPTEASRALWKEIQLIAGPLMGVN
jgi:hypothetical protein